MKLDFYGCTRTGQVRKQNEDALLMRTDGKNGLFLVADGIGGREHGKVVSGMLRDSYQDWWEHSFIPAKETMSFHDALKDLRDVLIRTNRKIIQNYGEMKAGSTLVLLFLFRGNCAYLSAGDSRIYRVRNLGFRQITWDDNEKNLPGYKSGREGSGKLTGAVGIRVSLQFSIRTDHMRTGDYYFLCSDGVYRYISSASLHRRLVLDSCFLTPKYLIQRMESIIEKKGAADNYTMIFIRVKN